MGRARNSVLPEPNRKIPNLGSRAESHLKKISDRKEISKPESAKASGVKGIGKPNKWTSN